MFPFYSDSVVARVAVKEDEDDARQQQKATPVSITSVISGSYIVPETQQQQQQQQQQQHQQERNNSTQRWCRRRCDYIVLLCSNDVLVVRYCRDDALPAMRVLTWFATHHRRILAMDVNASGDQLMCVCKDHVAYLLPILAFLETNATVEQPRMLNPFFDAQFSGNDYKDSSLNHGVTHKDFVEPVPSLSMLMSRSSQLDREDAAANGVVEIPLENVVSSVCQVLHWRDEYMIAASYDGKIIFLDVETHETSSLDTPFAIRSVHLLEGKNSTVLLIHSLKGQAFLHCIEYQGTLYPRYPNGDKRFKLVALPDFDDSRFRVSVQHFRGNFMVGVFDAQQGELRLYEPMALLQDTQVQPTTRVVTDKLATRHICVGSFVLSLRLERQVTHVTVVATSEDSKTLTSNTITPQTFTLPGMLGVTKSKRRSSLFLWNKTQVMEIHRNSRCMAAAAHFLLHNNKDNDEEKQQNLQRVLFLLLEELTDDDAKTPVQEQVAHALFDAGAHERALKLYEKCDIASERVIERCIGAKLYVQALDLLYNIDTSKMHGSQHVVIANLIVSCSVMVLLYHSVGLVSRQDQKAAKFESFLETNKQYNPRKAIETLMEVAIPVLTTRLAVRVGHARDCMGTFVRQLAEHSLIKLTSRDVSFLFNRGYTLDLLRSVAGSIVFDSLEPWQQLEMVFMELLPPDTGGNGKASGVVDSGRGDVHDEGKDEPDERMMLAQRYIGVLEKLVPQLDQDRLQRLLVNVDPGVARRGVVWAQHHRPNTKVQLVELFLVALVWVVRRAAEETERAPHKCKKGDEDEKDRPPYGQPELFAALQKYASVYHLHIIVAQCTAAKNWHALAKAYEVSGRISDAIECRVMHVEQLAKRCGGCGCVVEDITGELVTLLGKKEEWDSLSASERTRLLRFVWDVWKKVGLEQDVLEDALIPQSSHLIALAPVLFPSTTTTTTTTSTEEEKKKDYSPSSRLLTHAALALVHDQSVNPSQATLDTLDSVGRGGFPSGALLDAPGDLRALLASVLEHVSAQLLAHEPSVVFDTVTSRNSHGGVATGKGVVSPASPVVGEEEIIVFSCGHVFPSKFFFRVLLRSVREQERKREEHEEHVVDALLERYQSPSNTGLPCPNCAIARLQPRPPKL